VTDEYFTLYGTIKMLDELRTIIAIEGISQKDALEARKLALEYWIGKYVSVLEIENSIVKKHLNASEMDFLKLHQTYQLAEKIIEEHAMVSTEGNKIKVKVLVLNKDFPKNKE
jgi:hypothetical protein